jgi:pimeloyl-ACP methyl ester carboxylesterase
MTVEVDVIGFSMGGLVARHAARPNSLGKRLNIRRLFTISSPHRGARLASLPTVDQRMIDMRPGSAFLADLNSHLSEADYELLAYTRLGDMIVGPENAAPPGMSPWWVANASFSLAHISAGADPRILADIARRLRNEPPFTTTPASPLPGEEPTGDEETSKRRNVESEQGDEL